MSLDGSNSVIGMGGYGQPAMYRQPPGPADYPTSTVPRNYHYGPPAGYDDYRGGPPSDTYASLNRGMRMDPNYRLASSLCICVWLKTIIFTVYPLVVCVCAVCSV